MGKRRVNKQQSTRIEKIQQNYLTNKNTDTALFEGLVLCRHSRHVEILDNAGHIMKCSIRPHLETLVAGDRIIWQQVGENQGVVVSLCPRLSVLAKPSEKKSTVKPVAANITQIIIVVAALPEISWPLLDSYLIMADFLQIPAMILLNKTDLMCADIKQRLSTTYSSLGYPLFLSNTRSGEGIEELNEQVKDHINVFVGQSGVGKSSLIAALLPNIANIATNELSTSSQLGKHTTSNSRYYFLPQGGAIIDSPGVREFHLWHLSANEIAQGYREFKPYLNQCKFRNCEHDERTPGCAIIEALNKKIISSIRYQSFLKLCEQYAA
ncbi:MAG: ribosome small subunit-dependent GTPase A [Legionella sp. 40-6]|nr:ribosome small subunit-dependent GTPase A [Legionella sp.]OJX91059.1 MAG: ribosome small subunit-dependent GTPase A [Legionella sp. 40-6]